VGTQLAQEHQLSSALIDLMRGLGQTICGRPLGSKEPPSRPLFEEAFCRDFLAEFMHRDD